MKTRMQLKVAITTRRHTGWRVNATPESDPPEAIIAERAAAAAIDRKRKQLRTKRTLALLGFVFLRLPPLLPVVFFIHGAISGFPMPFRMYPILVLTFRPAANIGSIFSLLRFSRSKNA